MNKTFLLVGIIFFIFWTFWIPGLKVANDYHFSADETVVDSINPFVWKETNIAEGLGEYTITTLWSQPLHTIFGSLALLGLPFEIRTKLLGLIILVTAFLSIRTLLKFINVGIWGEIVGSLFYLTSTFFILMFDGGQLSLALAYGVLPAIAIFFLKIWKDSKFLNKIWLSFFLLVLSFLDPRIIYLVAIIFFLYFLFQLIFIRTKDLLKNYFQIVIFSIVLIIGTHFYWVLPALLTNLPSLPQGYNRQSQIDFLSFSSIGHSIFLQQPHWPQNIFGKVSPMQLEFIFIPFLAFLSLFLKRKDTTTLFWAIIALIGIFLSKGSQQPFPTIYPWLFENIPGFSLFRDPVKFYFLIALAYSVLVGITVGQMQKIIKFSPILVIAYLIFIARPVFLGQMTGLLSIPAFESEFTQFANYLKEDPNFSRVFWVPAKSPLGYSNSLHPYLDAGRMLNHRDFAIGTKGTYEVFNFLREAPFMGEIFDVAGVGYIVNPYPDPKLKNVSFDDIKYFYTFSNQLSGLSWLSKIPDSKIPLFKVKEHQDKFFITTNVWWIIGSDNIYNEATKSAKLKLAKNGLIFAEEFAGLSARLDELSEAKIVLNEKTFLDLAASFINPSRIIFPAKNLGFDPDQSGWWKREAVDLVLWRDFLQTKYGIDNKDFDLGGGWAVGEGKKEFTIYNLQFTKDKILLVRVMESSRSGSLKFYQKDQLIREVETEINGDANIRWFEVGNIKDERGLTVESKGDINVVNALAVLEKQEWETIKEKAKRLEGRIVNFDETNAQDDINPKVTYQKINPTKYIVDVNGLTHPALLVFSQNYDSLWKLNDQTPLPVYSLLNGFKVEKDGQYLLEYEPQKYVLPGLLISSITVVILTALLFQKRKK